LAGIYYGAQYGGSTTAILVNIPGESSSVVTTLDGHQMARKGRAGPALGISAIGSFVAGCIATLVVAYFAPPPMDATPGVVGCGGNHLVRPAFQPDGVGRVKLIDRTSEPPRIATHFIERGQDVVAIVSGVFDTFGLNRRRVLLKLHRKPAASLHVRLVAVFVFKITAGQQDAAHEEKDGRFHRRVSSSREIRGKVDGHSIRGRESRCVHVGAIDREERHDLDQCPAQRIQGEVPGTAITLRNPFERVRKEGGVARGQFLSLGVLALGAGETVRAGFVTSRRVGGAVVRNRIRRRLREIFRRHQHDIIGGAWIVTIASPRAAAATYHALEDEWLRLAKRTSILAS